MDVDESRVLQSCGDESTVLPPRLCRGLREALQCAIPDKNTSLTPAHNLVASEALIALFVQLVGHYHDHIITSSTTGQRDFQVSFSFKLFLARFFKLLVVYVLINLNSLSLLYFPL